MIIRMQSAPSLTMCLQICRYIGSSSTNLNLSRESKFIKKLMQKTKKSKKIWYDTSADLRNTIDVNPVNKSLSVHTMRRMTIRNKLFMEHITDLMSMGEVSNIISNSIEVTHVKISPDFKYVNVFWISSNDNASSVDKEALQECARIIRHELSQLRVIGIVPPIQFVENKQFSIKKEIEKRLATMDIEEDTESLSYSEKLRLAVSHISSDNDAMNRESASDLEVDKSHIELPVMRHDVLGLDHHKIMSQIAASLSKSKKAVERRMLGISADTDDSPHDLVLNKPADFLTKEEQQEVFSDFLAKRRIEERRKYRMKHLRETEIFNNNYEEETDFNDEDDNNTYSNEFDDEHSDKFEDRT